MTSADSHEKLGVLIRKHRKSWMPSTTLLLIFLIPASLLLQADLNNNDSIMSLLPEYILFFLAIYAIADCSTYRVALYKNGLVTRSLFGKKVVYFNATTKIWYSSIQEFINGMPVGTHTNIKITDNNNSIKLGNSLVGIDHLREAIAQIESTIICPALTVAYLKGKPIDFSALKLNRDHVFVKSKSLHIAKISRMELEGGIFTIWQNNQHSAFCRIPTNKIANLYTFQNILPAISPLGQAERVG